MAAGRTHDAGQDGAGGPGGGTYVPTRGTGATAQQAGPWHLAHVEQIILGARGTLPLRHRS
eukprot:10271634-Lingulodinium_polyedra.AAC.1